MNSGWKKALWGGVRSPDPGRISLRDSTDRYQSALTIPLDGRLESTPGEGAPDLEYEVSP